MAPVGVYTMNHRGEATGHVIAKLRTPTGVVIGRPKVTGKITMRPDCSFTSALTFEREGPPGTTTSTQECVLVLNGTEARCINADDTNPAVFVGIWKRIRIPFF